jgi:hypothetical protein
MVAAGTSRHKVLDGEIAAGYGRDMKRSVGDYLIFCLLVLVMCATIVGAAMRIYQAAAGG